MRVWKAVNELMARYGQGSNAGAPKPDFPVAVMMFHKQNWTITVSLINAISVGEKYQKSGGVDDASVQTLLDINSEGHPWKLTQGGPSLMAALLRTPKAHASSLSGF